jgi:hypothetical protein
MVLLTGRRTAHALPFLRLLALLPLSLLAGHEVVFRVQYGLGDDLRQAMSAGGHDGYWHAFGLVVLALTSGVAIREAIHAVRLRWRLRGRPVGPARGSPGAIGAPAVAWHREFGGLWPLLFSATAIVFTIQENLEHIAAGETPHGLGALIGGEHPLAVPVLAGVSAVVAALGALVRWRVRVLEQRVAGLARLAESRWRPPRRIAPAPEWPVGGSFRAHAWFLVRLLAGRAPPAVA